MVMSCPFVIIDFLCDRDPQISQDNIPQEKPELNSRVVTRTRFTWRFVGDQGLGLYNDFTMNQLRIIKNIALIFTM